MSGLLYKILSVIFKILSYFPKNKKLVVFESFLGDSMAGNPKYIYLEMVKQGLDKKYCIVWSLKNKGNDAKLHGEYRIVKYNTVKYYYNLIRCNVLITNSRIPQFVSINKKCTYLQTWHGTPLKKLALDQEKVFLRSSSEQSYKRGFVKISSQFTYLLSQNAFSSECFHSAFAYPKEKILEYGYPRCDLFSYDQASKDEIINSCKKTLGIPADSKVVMYAPTFRDDQHSSKHYSHKLMLDLEKLSKTLGDDYYVVLRLHYLISESLDTTTLNNKVIDASKYQDIAELYLISDILITDYSSVMFDYSLTNNPIYFFMYDLDDYRDRLRGFYFDIKELPGPIVKTEEELLNSIKNNEHNKYKKEYQAFKNKYTYLDDGFASKRCIKKVFNKQ